jgi:hypothetical protein
METNSSYGQPTPPAAPPGPPILSKAVASMILGYLSVVLCACLGFPSILLGGTAIWLGVWVQRNYTGNTASEFANVGSWMGMIVGGIGVVLGIISSFMWLFGIAGPIVVELTK